MDWATLACVFLQIPPSSLFSQLKSYSVQDACPASPITHLQEITLGVLAVGLEVLLPIPGSWGPEWDRG